MHRDEINVYDFLEFMTIKSVCFKTLLDKSTREYFIFN